MAPILKTLLPFALDILYDKTKREENAKTKTTKAAKVLAPVSAAAAFDAFALPLIDIPATLSPVDALAVLAFNFGLYLYRKRTA